jgi:energy-converting hydrogenase Eha subunit A
VDVIFQGILFASSAAFFLGAVFQTPTMAFGISVIVQMCVGGYWPSVGYLRGRYVVPELRVTFLTISRYYNKQYSNHK